MKTALVTGASSGIGLAISRKLLEMNYKVYGIGRDFSKSNLENENFKRIICDIRNINQLLEKAKDIKKEHRIYILINNAGVGYFGPHEELNKDKIHDMVTINLEVPMVLTNFFLRDLKKNKGYVINISSVTAKQSSTYGCAYSATKSGLTHFSESLFDETRKTGVKVITIHPDMTKTNFYRNSNFMEGDLEESYITSKCIADAVETILTQRIGTVITDITIKPQKHMIKRK